MTQTTKKQHYVPQSYLKRFTEDGKHLHVFDKISKKSFPASIGDIAHENYFYDIPDADAPGGRKSQLEEQALSALEGRFNVVIDAALKFAEDGEPVPTVKQRLDMSLCAAVQLIRTRRYRDDLLQSMEAMGASVFESVLQKVDPEKASQLRIELKDKENYAPVLHAQFMWDPDFVCKVAEILCTHIWVIGVNKSNFPLITSDSPVVLRANKQRAEYIPDLSSTPPFEWAVDIVIESKRPGIASEGVEVVFPLSPQCALIFLERKFFKSFENRDGWRFHLNDEHVQELNTLQVLQSYRQVYSCSNDFSLAENVCAKHPEECDSASERFQINIMELTPDNSDSSANDTA